MLVSVDTYHRHTRDLTTSSVEVTGHLADAQALIEDYLDRPLEYQAGTVETLTPYRDENRALAVTPRRVPVTAAADGTVRAGGREILSLATFGVFVSESYWRDVDAGGCDPLPLEVTFDGGWSSREDTTTTRPVLPVDLERAICFVARGLGRETDLVGVVGTANVQQATVGDVTVQFAEAGTQLDRYAFGITVMLEAYRYRSLL